MLTDDRRVLLLSPIKRVKITIFDTVRLNLQNNFLSTHIFRPHTLVIAMADRKLEDSWSSFGFRLLINTASHPIEYAKVLIQIGHEPVAPYATKTFFGRPAQALPNVFRYVSYIKSVDGFVGCYRGLGPKLCSNIISNAVFKKTASEIFPSSEDDKKYEEMSDEERHILFLQTLVKDLCARSAAVIASQPFNVIALRTMAQFVGGETKYTGLVGSTVEVYRESGVLGFFSGLVPRLIGELATLFLAAILTHTANKYLVEDPEIRTYTSICMSYAASALCYPFHVVANTMAVNNCGLIAGLPPHAPIYLGWRDCWSDLKKTQQLKRGSSLLFRYYAATDVGQSTQTKPSSKNAKIWY